jgi:CBS domain-containing protein
MQVRDVMTTKVRTIWPTASLKEAAFFLREYHVSGLHVSGLPVVDARGRVVGVVSESDHSSTPQASDGPGGSSPTST